MSTNRQSLSQSPKYIQNLGRGCWQDHFWVPWPLLAYGIEAAVLPFKCLGQSLVYILTPPTESRNVQ